MNHQWLEIVLRPQTQHLFAQRIAQLIRRPLAWAGGENLQRVAPDAVGALGGIVNSSRGRGVNSNAAGSRARRVFRRWTSEDVLFARHGAGHEKSIKGFDALFEYETKKPRPLLTAACVSIFDDSLRSEFLSA
jgi:hypothetical protein